MATKKTPAPPKPSLGYRAKRDPALLRKALADPGLRSKLPDNLLSVAQRKVRATNQYKADVGDITTPLAGSSLLNVARGLTDQQYAPQLNEIGRQETQVGAQRNQSQARSAAIYQQLAQYMGSAQAAQQRAGAAGAAAIQHVGDTTSAEISQVAQQQGAQAAKDAAVRGQGLDGGANAAQDARIANMQSQAALTTQGAQMTQNTNAGAQDALLRGIGAATQQQGGEQQSSIGAAARGSLDKLAAARTDLGDKKGASYTDTLLKLRQSGIDQNITQAGLGIKQDAATTAATDKAQTVNSYGYSNADWLKMTPAQRQKIIKQSKADGRAPTKDTSGDINSYGYTNAAWKAMSTEERRKIIAKGKSGSPGGKTKWGTPGEQGKASDGISGAVPTAQMLKKAGYSRSQAAQTLTSGSKAVSQPKLDSKGKPVIDSQGHAVVDTSGRDIPKTDQLLASVALDVAFDGHISAANVKKLHARGIKVNALGYPTKAPKTTAPPPRSEAAAGSGY